MRSPARTKTFVGLLTTVVLALLVVAAVAVRIAAGSNGSGAERSVVSVDLSWAWSYGSLGELEAAADLVVDGQVVSLTPSEDLSAPGLAASLFTLRVNDVVKGSAEATVVVKQTGGIFRDTYQRVADDPLMATGDHVLLYLRRIDSGPYAGAYFILGGPQGRFGVGTDGTLRPIGNIAVPAGVTLATLED